MNILRTIKKGFTLVELVIYLGIFSLFFTGLVGISVVASNINSSAKQQQVLQQVKLFLSEHIGDSFLNSHRIDNPTTASAGVSSELKLVQLAQGTSTITNQYDYQLVQNQIYFYTGTGAIPSPCVANTCKALTDPVYAKVTNMSFNLVRDLLGNSTGVRVTIDLQGVISSQTTSTLQTEFTIQ